MVLMWSPSYLGDNSLLLFGGLNLEILTCHVLLSILEEATIVMSKHGRILVRMIIFGRQKIIGI